MVAPGEDREVLEIYGKEYDVHWGTVTNTYTNVERIVARSWIEVGNFLVMLSIIFVFRIVKKMWLLFVWYSQL